MGEKRRTESGTSHPLVEKVLASRPAVAQLIGFNVEEISGGARGRLPGGGAATRQSYGHNTRGSVMRSGRRGNGHGLCVYPRAKRVIHYHVAEHQLLSAYLASATPRRGAPLNRGKNMGYVECEVADQDGKQVAKANSTCFVLRGEHTKQR